jgi:mono/diheme cytochrome c family protein
MKKIMFALLLSGTVLLTSCSDSSEPQTGQSSAASEAQSIAQVAQPDPVQGKVIFADYCAACHAAGMDHPGTMNLAEKYGTDKAPLVNRDDLSAEYVKVIVRKGLRLMPPLRPGELNDRQLDDLAAYLSATKPAVEAL